MAIRGEMSRGRVAEIPDKLYFKIGEVAEIAGVEAYVLRFWETEFPGLAPKKTDSGHRLYRRSDVEKVFRIKELLYEKGFTIAGARKRLSPRNTDPDVQDTAEETLSKVRRGLEDILTLLDGKT
jgi:DNA-binding transcriptional MerR regulator